MRRKLEETKQKARPGTATNKAPPTPVPAGAFTGLFNKPPTTGGLLGALPGNLKPPFAAAAAKPTPGGSSLLDPAKAI